LQIFTRHARYVSILKWGCLSLRGYAICAFIVHVAWDEVAWAVVWPPLSLKAEYLMAIVAVMGTTISPYLFFWQAGQEVEDTKEGAGARPLTRAPEQAPSEFTRIRIDTYIGMRSPTWSPSSQLNTAGVEPFLPLHPLETSCLVIAAIAIEPPTVLGLATENFTRPFVVSKRKRARSTAS
jgi:natural resistance-associated macrophage protein